MTTHRKSCYCGGKGYVVVRYQRAVKGQPVIVADRLDCWGRPRKGRGKEQRR